MDEEAKAIVAAIEAAFAKMKPGPLTLQQAAKAKYVPTEQLEGWYAMPSKRHWTELVDQEIEDCGKALYGADLKSWLGFVPAWMRWSLRHFKHNDSFVSDQIIYALDPKTHRGRFEYFTLDQQRAISLFLAYMANSDTWADADVAQRALDQYWSRHAPADE
ncbi:MAG: DUF6714 family protein [Planctomycetota bacterium]